ncbi:MAG: hypothetical protein U1F43_04085 [Myxococcota bacterium]
MKPFLMTTAALISGLALHGASHATEPAPAARAWLDAILAGRADVAVPSAEAPLWYDLEAFDKSCKKLGGGTAKDKKALKKVAGCLRATWRGLPSETPVVARWEASSVDQMQHTFSDEHAAEIKAATDGASMQRAIFEGEGGTMITYLAVGAHGEIRGVWMQTESIE